MHPTSLLRPVAPAGADSRASRASVLIAACLASVFALPVASAQVAPSPTSPPPNATAAQSAAVVLSPFEVSAAEDKGYAASSALSGTRTNEKLANLPNSISVFTADLMSDLALTDFFGAVDFAVGAENQFNDQGTIGAPVGSRSGNQINFRGIPSIRQLRDGYPWFLPQDAFNTERIEFSRGPGGLAYGDVDPAGIINISTKRATFQRRATASIRYDNFGTQRYSVDINQPVLPRLGVRFNALASEVEQYRQRNNRNHHGYAGAIRWEPFAHRRTRLDATLEVGRTSYQLGHLHLNDHVTVYNRGSGTNAPDADPVRAGVQINGVGMRRIAAPGNTHVHLDIGGTLYDMQSTATTTFRNTATVTGVDSATDPQNPTMVPLLPVSYGITPYGRDWGGPDNRADSKFHAYTIELSHAFSNNLRALVSFNGQVDDTKRPQTYSAAGALGVNSRGVFVDVNRVLPHPTIPGATIPNPRFEEYFIVHAPTYVTDGHDIHGWRGTGVYDTKLPFFDATLRLVASTSYRREKVYLNTFNFALAREEITRRGFTGAAATFPNNLVHPVHYLADGNSDEALRLRVTPGLTNWYRAGGNNSRFDQSFGAGTLTALNSFFKGRLHTSAGVSRDYFRQNRSRNNITNAATGEVLLVDLAGVPLATPGQYNVPTQRLRRDYTTSQSYGGVFRVLPWLGLGAGYFESSLFTDSAGTDLTGAARLPRTGEGVEYSLRFNFLDERVNATVTRFETVAENNAVGLSAAAQLELNAVLPAGQQLIGTGDYRDQTSEGYEAEIQLNLTRQWTVRATYSMSQVIFTRFFPLTGDALGLARTAAQQQGLNPDEATQLTAQFLSDQEGAASRVRRETASLVTRYSFDRGDLKGLALGVSARYALGKLRVNNPGNTVAGRILYPAGRTNDHVLVNPFASYRRKLLGRTWTLQVNVNNVFDLRSDQGNNWTWPRFTDPRQYITSLSVDW
jgi:outer membrane receptor for ferric coprogen and ferric-rhodotorulic acid